MVILWTIRQSPNNIGTIGELIRSLQATIRFLVEGSSCDFFVCCYVPGGSGGAGVCRGGWRGAWGGSVEGAHEPMPGAGAGGDRGWLGHHRDGMKNMTQFNLQAA